MEPHLENDVMWMENPGKEIECTKESVAYFSKIFNLRYKSIEILPKVVSGSGSNGRKEADLTSNETRAIRSLTDDNKRLWNQLEQLQDETKYIKSLLAENLTLKNDLNLREINCIESLSRNFEELEDDVDELREDFDKFQENISEVENFPEMNKLLMDQMELLQDEVRCIKTVASESKKINMDLRHLRHEIRIVRDLAESNGELEEIADKTCMYSAMFKVVTIIVLFYYFLLSC